jgi:hypothetical protein
MFSFLPESPLGFRQVALTKIGAARATKQQGKQTCHTRFVKKTTQNCAETRAPQPGASRSHRASPVGITSQQICKSRPAMTPSRGQRDVKRGVKQGYG